MAPRLPRDRERGAGHVMAVGAILAACFVAFLLVAVGSVVIAHHRATGAADLAALAGAQAAVDAGVPANTETLACAAARQVAEAHQATLDSCATIAFAHFVAIEIEVSVPSPVKVPPVPPRLTAQARAGNPGG